MQVTVRHCLPVYSRMLIIFPPILHYLPRFKEILCAQTLINYQLLILRPSLSVSCLPIIRSTLSQSIGTDSLALTPTCFATFKEPPTTARLATGIALKTLKRTRAFSPLFLN